MLHRLKFKISSFVVTTNSEGEITEKVIIKRKTYIVYNFLEFRVIQDTNDYKILDR